MRWYHVSTGGGCSAERVDLPSGAYALLTDASEHRECLAPNEQTTEYVVGLYDADDFYLTCETGTRAECIAWLETKIGAR